MKKILAFILSIVLSAVLLTGLFACKKGEETAGSAISESALAAEVAEAAFPERADRQEIADALLELLRAADMEKGEILDALTALKEAGTSVAPALLSVKENAYSQEDFVALRDALRIIAKAVSPEVAGEVYYAAAQAYAETLPYTLSDCRKVAVIYFSQDESFSLELLEELRAGGSTSATRKQLNTALITLAASLRSAQGISTEARDFLFSLAEESLAAFRAKADSYVDLSDTSDDILSDALVILHDHFDIALSYFAYFFSYSDARLFLGNDYDRKEATVHYGYRYEGWVETEITEEEYLARSGDYDEYFKRTYPRNGYYDGDRFVPISDEDVALAEQVYRFRVAYRAYQSLSESEKEAFLTAAEAVLTALSDRPALLAGLLDKPLIEPTEEPGATFEEVLAAFSALSDTDGTDGFDEREREQANAALTTFERYLHGYLPTLY